VDPGNLHKSDVYLKALSNQQIINSIKDENGLSSIKEAGFRSLLIAPLLHHGECIGLIEFGSQKDHAFDFYSATRLVTLSEYVAMAINHVHEGEHERIMAVIKQTCTAIHPSVEWRFQEMARNYLQQIEHDEIPTPEPVIFKSVVPLFGVSDIRGSSTKRNDSIQADLEHQLGLAAEVIATAGATHPRPVFNELGFRIQQHQAAIAKGLRSGDETRIYMFLRQVVESAFDELGYLSDEIRGKIDQYRKQLDPEVGVVYQVRKSYDQSVMQINDTIGAYIDMQQELAQKMIPHYFEKFKTDGVDHNIYVGDSLLESGTCSPLDLRNLYLWQLMTMCGVVWLMRDIKPQLNTPLDTAHLILVQSTPLNITFQPEEKHFSVDGAYNARYEIVKKRIDKACIQRTGERLTQPGQIAIVYTQEREYQMYRDFITYLQNLGFLTENVIDELLEDLQGVHGLRALRVKVTEQPPKGWDPKKPQTSLGIEWGPNSK
ncbi:MAG: GAF domain-containing protein, partial [Myxococcota bacterium]|nr:GAF domain-containing protein [Myxococcota bacterium]